MSTPLKVKPSQLMSCLVFDTSRRCASSALATAANPNTFVIPKSGLPPVTTHWDQRRIRALKSIWPVEFNVAAVDADVAPAVVPPNQSGVELSAGPTTPFRVTLP